MKHSTERILTMHIGSLPRPEGLAQLMIAKEQGKTIDVLFMIQGDALSIEAANPRHEHEWRVFEEVRLAEEEILIPSVIDTCSTYIEHPEVIAQRIVRFAQVVGRENVIAGTDCGFGTFLGTIVIAPSVAWDKLRSLAEGARLASEELW